LLGVLRKPRGMRWRLRESCLVMRGFVFIIAE
jgi:hypothetical protein